MPSNERDPSKGWMAKALQLKVKVPKGIHAVPLVAVVNALAAPQC